MEIDIRILSVIISASVAIFIAVLNHFIITPIKERRNRKREQLKNLYAPLYSLLCIKIKIAKEYSIPSKKILFGSLNDIDYQSEEYLQKFILEKSGFASNALINAFVNYSSEFEFEDDNNDLTRNLVIVVTKEYNRLKKELNLPLNKVELKTGIPECIKEFRDFL